MLIGQSCLEGQYALEADIGDLWNQFLCFHWTAEKMHVQKKVCGVAWWLGLWRSFEIPLQFLLPLKYKECIFFEYKYLPYGYMKLNIYPIPKCSLKWRSDYLLMFKRTLSLPSIFLCRNWPVPCSHPLYSCVYVQCFGMWNKNTCFARKHGSASLLLLFLFLSALDQESLCPFSSESF